MTHDAIVQEPRIFRATFRERSATVITRTTNRPFSARAARLRTGRRSHHPQPPPLYEADLELRSTRTPHHPPSCTFWRLFIATASVISHDGQMQWPRFLTKHQAIRFSHITSETGHGFALRVAFAARCDEHASLGLTAPLALTMRMAAVRYRRINTAGSMRRARVQGGVEAI
jgi:hypothetical protein